jgi:hypothetical protein
MKSLDWETRHTVFCCRAPREIMPEVLSKAGALLGQ